MLIFVTRFAEVLHPPRRRRIFLDVSKAVRQVAAALHASFSPSTQKHFRENTLQSAFTGTNILGATTLAVADAPAALGMTEGERIADEPS